MDLRAIDLNLLLIFNQLMLERRVSSVAEHLGITQPAVSNALKRLRDVLGDELFLRTAKGMEPTPYAIALAEPIQAALGLLNQALNQAQQFEPQTARRTFTLAMTDIGEIYFLPPLLDKFASIAPQVKISTVRPYSVSLKEQMMAGSVDLALGLLPHLQAGFHQRHLFRQRYVCLYRKHHPVATPQLTLGQFCQLEHVGIIAPQTGHSEIDTLLERAGIQRRMRVVVPHFIAVGHILQSTDLIASVPERFAERCVEPFGLEIAPHPATLPDIEINVFWHAKYQRDPANQWLRQLLAELFAVH